MATRVVSKGDGSWSEVQETAENEGITPELLKNNRAVVEAQNTFKGLPSSIDNDKIPEAFRKAFNKNLETEHEGITYRYKDLDFMELLSYGQNPYSLELTRLAQENPDDSNEEILKKFNNLEFRDLLDIAITDDMRKKNLLKASLIDMRVGDEVLEITPEHINSMTVDLREYLYNVITKQREAEDQAVLRFHERFAPQVDNVESIDTHLPNE